MVSEKHDPSKVSFQFTHPGGVRLPLTEADVVLDDVSIHAPGRGATPSSAHQRLLRYGFNSRTREGCDSRESVTKLALRVSIHAPGRGATTQGAFGFPDRQVSIHAPGRGATSCPICSTFLIGVSIHAPGRGATSSPLGQISIRRCFNSRTREGCDHSVARGVPTSQVSIHAPGRGATSTQSSHKTYPWSFNSRTREGCDRA